MFDYKIPENKWVNVCLTATDSEVNLFVDAEKVCAPILGSFDLPTEQLGIAESTAHTRSFSGFLSQVRYFSRVLSAEEIRDAMCGQSCSLAGTQVFLPLTERKSTKLKNLADPQVLCQANNVGWKVREDCPTPSIVSMPWQLRTAVGFDSRQCKNLYLDSLTPLSAIDGLKAVEDDLIEMVGIFKRKPNRLDPQFMNSHREPCHIQYRPKLLLDTSDHVLKGSEMAVPIEGSIEWPERDLVACLDGVLENKTTWTATISTIIKGECNEMSWIKGMVIKGQFDEVQQICEGKWQAQATAVPLPVGRLGNMHFDPNLMPEEFQCVDLVRLTAPNDEKKRCAPILLAAEDCVFPRDCPFGGQMASLDQASMYWGFVEGKRIWEIKISKLSGFIGIGLCTSSFAHKEYDPEDEGLWCYTCERIGSKCSSNAIESFGQGDVIGVELDIKNDQVEFYRNGISVGLQLRGFKDHPAFQDSVPNSERGVRPCVILSSKSEVNLSGFRNTNKPLTRKTYDFGDQQLNGTWVNGYLHGKGTFTQDNPKVKFSGDWLYGYQHGLHLMVEVDGSKESNPKCFMYNMGEQECEATFEESKELIAEWRKIHDPDYSETESTKDGQKEVSDSQPEANSDAECKPTSEHLNEAVEEKSLQDETKEGTNKNDNEEVTPEHESEKEKKEAFTAQSLEKAPYSLKVIHRDGVHIWDKLETTGSKSIGKLDFGTEVEGYKAIYTLNNLLQFQLKDGSWISQVNGAVPTTQILRHSPKTPLCYKIISDTGAKLRSEPDLNSPECGEIPKDTIVQVSERKQLDLPSFAICLKVTSPEQYTGWISEKSDIVVQEFSEMEKEEIERTRELERRKEVRARRSKLQETASKDDELSKHITIEGSFKISSQTLFLLSRKDHFRSGVPSISDDFTTASAASNSKGFVLGTKGFQSGVHYWQIQIDGANWENPLILGVAPKSADTMFLYASNSMTLLGGGLNSNEKYYGEYFKQGDKIGVLLDMDRGTLSFVKDGEETFSDGGLVVAHMGIAFNELRQKYKKLCGRRKKVGDAFTLHPVFGLMTAGDIMSVKNQNWWSKKGFDSAECLAQAIDSLVTVELWRRSRSLHGIAELPNWVLISIYQLFKKWKAQEQTTYISRAGVEVEIATDTDLIRKYAGPVGDMMQLDVGRRFTSPHGKGKIVGVARGNVWFDMDGEERGCFYWNSKELTDLVESGKIEFSDPSTNDQLKSVSELPVPTYQEFVSLLSCWERSKESALVNLMNVLCSRKGCVAAEISPDELREEITKKDSAIANEPFQVVEVLFSVLLYFNKVAHSGLEFVDLSRISNRMDVFTAEEIQSNASGTNPLAVCSSTGKAYSSLRELILTHVKFEHWHNIVEQTTTPTPLTDAFDRPSVISEINVNNMQAKQKLFEGSDGFSPKELLSASVFGQVKDSLASFQERSFRRGFVHVQDAGQARAFYVKFVGEGAEDNGGPYRTVFQTVSKEAQGPLELFVPCPNAQSKTGHNQDQMVLNTNYTDSEQLELYAWFGKLLGIACRHGIQMDLSLPPLFWKPLVSQPVSIGDAEAIDKGLKISIQNIEEPRLDPMERKELIQELLGDDIQLPDELRAEDLKHILQRIQRSKLKGNSKALMKIYQGLNAILPTELFPMFTANELSLLFCGTPTVDLEVLKSMTEYDGVSKDAPHIQYFWEALEEFDEAERQTFINFCWGKSRLPSSAADFSMHFKIKSFEPNTNGSPDDYLPLATTCFFSLRIPEYSSKEKCLEKLRYAIEHTDLMDADFVGDAAGWENIH